MAFRSSPHKDSFREAFGKAYIRLHPYTSGGWGAVGYTVNLTSVSFISGASDVVKWDPFQLAGWVLLGLVQRTNSLKPEPQQSVDLRSA
jgi:hypothetical protein